MKCPICDGGGRITSLPSGMPVKCTRCNGTGEVDMTEQEYIQSCNHKELAEILFRMIVHGSVIRPDRQYISEWLKQPHKPIS